ncbi:MAG: membrane protein insertion efficiency factor YidD [Crocinitomicaceae bacterium]|nr:membrane protein insertion efficiency factor YidD [Crocinitomicaceae bacterium]
MRKFLNKIFILPVRVYQWIISPLFPGSCRHEPTCSNYAVDAIEEWGPLKGMYLGIRRLSKCHPWGTWGSDPVPKKNAKKPNKENVNQECSNQLIKAG